MWTASDDAVWLENGSSTTFCSSRMVEIEPVIPHCTPLAADLTTLPVQLGRTVRTW